MSDVNIGHVTLIAGILIANIGAIVGFFVQLKLSVGKLEVKFEAMEKDVNNLGDLYRRTNNILPYNKKGVNE